MTKDNHGRMNVAWTKEEAQALEKGKEKTGIKNTVDFIRFLIKKFADKS